MKHGLLALIAGAAVFVSAMPGATAETQWSGFYVGGQLGGAWSDTGWHYENHNWFNTLGPVLVISNFDIDGGGGVLGGGQAGFNFQSGAWVFGVEGSVAGTDLDGSIRSPFFPASDVYTLEAGWLATVTGRIGYAWSRWLAYGKGGWAGADIELDLFDRDTPVRAKSSTWTDGYTLGGGAEYAFGSGFSLGVEYAFIDLGTDRFTVRCPTCPPGVGGGVPIVDGDIEIQSVTARLNYRLGN